MKDQDFAVSMYNTHLKAEGAVKKLQHAGYDMKKRSIVGKDYHTEENVVGYYNTGNRMLKWGGIGAFWGGIWGLLFGSAFFFVPGLGPLLLAGPLVASLVAALEGAVVLGGLSAPHWWASASPKTVCSNTRPRSRQANLCWWPTVRPKKYNGPVTSSASGKAPSTAQFLID
jgi:hypothetical protein